MPKYLHIELNPGGLYVYFDDKKWNAKIISQESQAEECNILNAVKISKDCFAFNEKVNIAVDLEKL
jgi:hypothetical protein